MKCANCDKSKNALLYKIDNFRVVQCRSCLLVYVDPQPSKKILNDFYGQEFDYAGGFVQEKKLRDEARKILNTISHFTKNKKLLDIGSGAGFLLDEAHVMGYQVTGVEMSAELVKYSKKKLKLDVVHGDFVHAKFKPSSFDVIILSQVIEHLPNFDVFLSKVNSLLQKEGVLYLATPNIESFSSMVLKKDFPYMMPPEHLYFFSPNTIKKLLEKHDFTIKTIRTYGYSQDLAGIVKRLVKGNMDTRSKAAKPGKKPGELHEQSLIKQFKYLMFDVLFCKSFYRLLNVGNRGSMLEVITTKKTKE